MRQTKHVFSIVSQPKGTVLRSVSLLVTLICSAASMAQGWAKPQPEDRAWAESLQDCQLWIVYPTFTGKHARAEKLLAREGSSGAGAQRIRERMAGERAYRDSLLQALRASWAAEYSLGQYRFLPDTSWLAWQNGHREITLLTPDGVSLRAMPADRDQILILRQATADHTTGTGRTAWRLSVAEQNKLPRKFPVTFSEGSLGTRFLQLFEAMLTFSDRPKTVGELRRVTDYLARQVDRKWKRYLIWTGQEPLDFP